MTTKFVSNKFCTKFLITLIKLLIKERFLSYKFSINAFLFKKKFQFEKLIENIFIKNFIKKLTEQVHRAYIDVKSIDFVPKQRAPYFFSLKLLYLKQLSLGSDIFNKFIRFITLKYYGYSYLMNFIHVK